MQNLLTRSHPPHRHQRGAAALVVTLALFFAMLLVTVYANRNLLFEQRSSANQYRSTQAFEAAEAGLEWAVAQLNVNRPIGDDCLPSADPTAPSFRSRFLRRDADSSWTPVTWSAAGLATALQASCVRAGGTWSCSCPASGWPTPTPAPAGDATPAPAFTVVFGSIGNDGAVRLSAAGCTSLAGACLPDASTSADATARIEIVAGFLPGLVAAPVASITTRGTFDADAAALGLHNADPATGLVVHAGGDARASHAHVTVPAGAPVESAFARHDAALAATSTDAFFASHFGLDKAAWKRQPAVIVVECHTDCAAALTAAIASAADSALIWVDGDLDLDSAVALGSLDKPVAIVVAGRARLEGAIALTGVLYAESIEWGSTSGGAYLRGAALSETDYSGVGTPELVFDAAVLAGIRQNTGTFARVNGSWRDF